MTSNWSKYQEFVLAELRELKESQKTNISAQIHLRDMIAEMRAEFRSLKTSQKWELRIMSAVWGLIILVINVIIGNHVK